ncbi:MAG TPA: glycosyltransferase family 87 protein [Anaerolineae bacterium]|nr:glycosyltransferase family 87 protein [Anaerolineae bacterium]
MDLTITLPRARTVWLARALAFAAFLFFCVRVFIPSLTAVTDGFPSYYTGARLIVEGRWSSQVYDYEWFRQQVLALTDGRIGETLRLNPPTTSLLMLPLALFDIQTARLLWLLINLLLLAAAFWLTFESLPAHDATFRAVFVAGALLYAPLWENFRVGQVYALLLTLYALAWWDTGQGRSPATGLALGSAAAIKLSGAPLWLLLALRGRFRALGIGLIVVAILSAASLLFSGLDGWNIFLFGMPERVASLGFTADLAFQTTPSFFQHLFVYQTEWNPNPILQAPFVATILTLLVIIFAVGLTCWFGREADWHVLFAAGTTLSVILFPLAEEYHYTLLLLPLAVVSWHVYQTRASSDLLWLALVVLLLALPFPYKSPMLRDGWLALLAYPRLYSGWLLFLWLLRQMVRPSAARVGSPSGATP